MHWVTTVAIPVLVVFMMTVVGLQLRIGDFQRVSAFPAAIAGTIVAQMVALPLLAALIIELISADLSLAGGLILVAVSPIAVISNYYAMLARANVALAV